MSILTKVAKGVAYGDVSNQAIRNILSEISKSIKDKFTEQEMIDTLDYFDWKCPYTGKDLSYLKNSDSLINCATDHIYPQNKEWCGLNVMGNLVIVDKSANSAKGSKDVKEFLLNDQKVLKGVDVQTRQARLKKIEEFQKKYNYDPNKIKAIISPLLKQRYDEVRKQQEDAINNALNELNKNGVNIIRTNVSTNVVFKAKTASSSKKCSTELVFNPSDENLFVDEFIKKKVARFVLTYDSGVVKESIWKCEAFDRNSNLRANVQSRPFWRMKNKEGLVKVEVIID